MDKLDEWAITTALRFLHWMWRGGVWLHATLSKFENGDYE